MYFIIKKNRSTSFDIERFYVRMKGLEPPRLSALDPKSSAATNYATSAIACANIILFFVITNILIKIYQYFTNDCRYERPFVSTIVRKLQNRNHIYVSHQNSVSLLKPL